jgi:hypothetical protein
MDDSLMKRRLPIPVEGVRFLVMYKHFYPERVGEASEIPAGEGRQVSSD